MHVFLAHNRMILLLPGLLLWGYFFYKQKDIPLLLVSLYLLFCIHLDLWYTIPGLIRLGHPIYLIDSDIILVWPSMIAGIWGVIRSVRGLMVTILRGESVLDRWNYIVEQGAGRGGSVLSAIESAIIDARMPGVATRREPIAIELFGEKRPFLVVQNMRYKEYKMYINARDFGVDLDVSWYFCAEPKLLKRTLSKHATGDPQDMTMRVSLFAQQDLSAFKSITHERAKRVLEALCEELKLDPTGINTGSRGFLNVW